MTAGAATQVRTGMGGRGLIPFTPPEWSIELAEVLGFFIGDGSATQRSFMVRFCGRAGEEAEWLERTLPHLIPLAWSKGDRGVVVEYSVGRENVWSWFNSLGLAQPQHLRPLPSGWEDLLECHQCALLRGLFEADGTVAVDGRVRLSTTSRVLAAEVVAGLQGMGISCSSYESAPRRPQKNAEYSVQIPHRALPAFEAQIGFLLPTKQGKLRYLVEHGRLPLRDGQTSRRLSWNEVLQ